MNAAAILDVPPETNTTESTKSEDTGIIDSSEDTFEEDFSNKPTDSENAQPTMTSKPNAEEDDEFAMDGLDWDSAFDETDEFNQDQK